MSEHVGLRGKAWFTALTGVDVPQAGDPGSVWAAEAPLGNESALFLGVVPNPKSRFPCVRDGQVGLEEAYALATHLRAAIASDSDKLEGKKRPIVAIVDVKSQAYGRREETAGIFFAAAVAADAYASARMAGHPVLSFIAGQAFSGGFLTHGYQANRIIALDDDGVVIHAMHKEAAARITRRTVAELEELGHEIAPMSYNVKDYAKLGLLFRLIHSDSPLTPSEREIKVLGQALVEARDDARAGSKDLTSHLNSDEAKKTRKASITVRNALEAQWQLA
jgi:malonate decarboxylase gamma subunit